MIEFHTWGTPNGRKISVALEEMGLPYKVHPVNIASRRSSIPKAPGDSRSAYLSPARS